MAGFMGHLQQLTSGKMLSLPVLLFFLIWGNAILVNAKPFRHHHHHNLEIWHGYLGSTETPEFLHVRMSAMEIDEKRDFLRLTKEMKLSSFCDSAYLFCKLKDDQSNTSFATSFRSEASPEKEHFLFRKSEIVVGQKITFEELESPVPFRRFLPKKLANKLPFGTKSLPKLLEMLSIPPDSHMAQTMEESMAICEGGKRLHQHQTCAKSLDGLVKFVAHNLGRNLQIFQGTVTDSVKGQDMTITDIALRGPLKAHKAVVCRDMSLPSLVFDCLVVEKVQIVEVKLVSEEKVEYRGLMKCNRREKEKRTWSMRKELGEVQKEEDDLKRCDWLSENEFVFVKKEEKKSKEEEDSWKSEEAMVNGEEMEHEEEEGIGKKVKKLKDIADEDVEEEKVKDDDDEDEEGMGKKMKKMMKRMEDFTHHDDGKDEVKDEKEDGEEGTPKKLKNNITLEDDSSEFAKNLKNNIPHEDDISEFAKNLKNNITHEDDSSEFDDEEHLP